jgi:hypothetical protein
MDHFKVFHDSMQVRKVDATACEIAALFGRRLDLDQWDTAAEIYQFVLTVQNIDSIMNRFTIALNGGRHLPKLEIVGAADRQ